MAKLTPPPDQSVDTNDQIFRSWFRDVFNLASPLLNNNTFSSTSSVFNTQTSFNQMMFPMEMRFVQSTIKQNFGGIGIDMIALDPSKMIAGIRLNTDLKMTWDTDAQISTVYHGTIWQIKFNATELWGVDASNGMMRLQGVTGTAPTGSTGYFTLHIIGVGDVRILYQLP